MWTKMVDLELTDEEKLDCDLPCMPINRPKYPYGLAITLDETVLAKLGLDHKDVSVGDMIDLRAFGVITAISENDSADGPRCRVEVQLQKIAVEDEATEEVPGDDEEKEAKPGKSRSGLREMYNK